MSTSKESTNTPPVTSAKLTSRPTKPSKKVILRLPSSILAEFPTTQPPRKTPRSKAPPTATPTPTPKVEVSTPVDDASESNAATPVPKNGSEGPSNVNEDSSKGKSASSSKTGQKRSEPSDDTKPTAKSRSRPGPKRRKVDIDNKDAAKTPWTAVPTAANHKLGPKANQGAINAGLRNLDRSGKPCRKWDKKGFQLRSFTGVHWASPSWKTPQAKSSSLTGDVKSETTGSSQEKAGNSSSAVGSERSNNGGDIMMQRLPVDIASSPAPTTAAQEIDAI